MSVNRKLGFAGLSSATEAEDTFEAIGDEVVDVTTERPKRSTHRADVLHSDALFTDVV